MAFERRPREHLHARKRRPPGRTPPPAATPSATTETLTKLNRDDHARGHRPGAGRAAHARSGTGARQPRRSAAPAGEAPLGRRRTAWTRVACSQWSGPRTAGMRCSSRCRGAVSHGQQTQDRSPIALFWRPVSQQPLARLTALYAPESPPGAGRSAVHAGRTAAGDRCGRRRRCARMCPLVSGGCGWSGRTPTRRRINARRYIRSGRAR